MNSYLEGDPCGSVRASASPQSCLQVRKILYQLFELCPTPEAAIEADTAVVEGIIRPLGLFRKRALMFKRFSREYIEKQVAFQS